MIDNQAARKGDDALGFLRDAVQAVQVPKREDVMGDALRTLGIDAKPQPPAPPAEISSEQAAGLRQSNIASMLGNYLAANPSSSPLGATVGLMADMTFAGMGGTIKGDADPLSIRTAMLQEGATAIGGEVFGSVVGGMANAGATAQKTVGQAVNTGVRWATGGQDIFDLDISDRTKQFLSGGYSSRNALMDSAPENRARFIRSNASEAEAKAATGMQSEMAFNVGDAMGQIGIAVLSSLIPGGQAAAGANATKAITTFGRAFTAVRSWASSPGAKLYLGYAGAQSAIGMSAEMDTFRRRENEAIDLFNESVERLGLPFEKRGHVEYDRLMDMGVSVASGVGTAALETVTAGLAKFGGGRIARRLMFGKADTLGSATDVIRATLMGAAIGGAGESFEEALDVYKDGFLRGIWNPYEEARFLRTFKGEDFWKTLKAYAPEAIDAAVTSFIAAGPLGGAGGAASVRRAGKATIAFHHAFMRDQMSRSQGSGPDVIASELVARTIVERVMAGDADPQVTKVVLEQLRSTGLAEVGSVTAEQMSDPEWVRSFVRRNPLLAAALADRFSSLSRSNIEWLTGPASRGRVPNADQRQQFLQAVKAEVRSLVPAYMRGWAERSAPRYAELKRTVDALDREMSGLEGEALEQAYARRMAALAEMSEIRQINNRMKAAWARGEFPTQEEFREWQALTAEVESADLDGTADAEADSPATEAFEAAADEAVAAENPDQPPPMSEAKRLRVLARQGDAEAAFQLARMHETGEGAEPHAKKAEYWLNVALASTGDADALFYLGEFYRTRVRSESGLKKAIVLLSRAARAGSTQAHAAIGEIQAQRGNTAQAVASFRKAGPDGAKGIARLVMTGQLDASEITTDLIQSLEQQSLAGDADAAGLFRWAIDARRSALASRATETPSAASAPQPASVAPQPASVAPQQATAAPAAIPADDAVARGVQPLLDGLQARRDAAQAEKDTKKAELERRARVRAERAEAGRRKAEEVKARREADAAVEPEAAAEPVAEPQAKAAPAPAPEPAQDEAARIEERIRKSPGSTGNERVRLVEPDTTIRKRIARAAAKLGRKVQFIAIEKSSGVIRGFISPDSDTIYIAVVPKQTEERSPEQMVEGYYLQALLHENAHLSLEDGTIRDRVDRVITNHLVQSFASRFDLGSSVTEVEEEVRVYTLTQDIVGSSGAADIVLGEGLKSAVVARLKELFAKALPFLPNARRKSLLASVLREQVAQAKAAKEAKPTPAPAAAEPAATRAAKPKPATQPTDDLARLIKDGQWVIGVTLEQGDQIQVVADGETVVLDSTSKAKGIDLRIIGKKLYLLRGSTTAVVTSAKVLAKPSVGKAKPKAAQPQQAEPQAAPVADPATTAAETVPQQAERRLDLMRDGIDGVEIDASRVPMGNEAFQYAMGIVERGGDFGIYRRKASERGTYGGWRWENYANKLADPAPDPANEPVASELPKPRRGRGKKGDGQQAMFMREISDSSLPDQAKSAIKRGHLMFMRAWHGGPKGIERFDPDLIRRIAYGWGLYATEDKATAMGYALQDGVAYRIDYDDASMIDLDADVSDQPQSVRDAFVQVADALGLRPEILTEYAIDDNYRSSSGNILYQRASDALKAFQLQVMFNLRGIRGNRDRFIETYWSRVEQEISAARAVSMMLLGKGIKGGRYADYRAKGVATQPSTSIASYVLYDPEAVQIIGQEEMPGNLDAWRKALDTAADSADRGVAFMRERTEGPVPDGMTRLYRVQPRAEARRRLDPDSWQYQAMESSGSIAAEGRWFTDNPEHASFYVNDIGRDNAEIVAVDVPTADLDKYRVSNFRGGEGVVDPRRFSARGMAEQEFFLPRNVADAARPSSDIRFMREQTDTQLAADHRAAFERGDEAAAREIVREYGRRKGYTIEAYHGSPSGPFTMFDEGKRGDRTSSRSSRLGFFATSVRQVASEYMLTQAEMRDNNKGGPIGFGLEDAYADLERYRDIDTGAEFDPGLNGWIAYHEERDRYGEFGRTDIDVTSVFDSRQEAEDYAEEVKNRLVRKAEEAVARQESRWDSEVRALAQGRTLLHLLIRMQNPFVRRYDGGDFRDQSYTEVIQEAIDEEHDGVILKDTVDSIDTRTVSDIYVFFDPNQAKSADPFTYDSNGELVPLDKRFDESTDDIRFMREKPTVASIKRTLSNIAPGSEFANNLATSFVWEYAILDREINRVAKEFGLEDEYRANDMLKVSPGKRAAAMLDFMNREVRPFEAAAEGLAKRTGMPVDLVLDKIKEYAFYVQSQDASKVLQAKVGESRGTVLKRAERLAAESGMSEDLALVEVWENMTSLGLTPEDAADGQARLEREFASDPMWMELVDRLRAMNRRTLELKREAGLITEESYQKLRSRYPNFVPVVRSIYDRDVDVDGSTYLPKNIKKRATRTMRGGQIVEESKLRSFWGASLAITQLDRNSAINQAARNAADNVLFLLSNRVDLETGDPIVGVSEDGEAIGLQTRSGQALLEPVYVDEEVRKTITRATVRAKTPRREDESVEEYRKRIDREVAYAQGQAMADMRTRLNNEASGEKPTLRRFKLDRDLDLTPPEIYEQAEQIMSSEDGLSDAERENNAKLEKRIAAERARLKSPEFAERVAEIEREIASLEASRRPGIDSTGIDARIDMLKKEKLLPKRRIASARSRLVGARNAEQREEARKSLLEQKQRLFKKGEIMYYRINDPTLASAMLVMRKTPLERMAESPLAVARMVAKGWFGLMSIMRFAYVQASVGFLVGEMQRSPQQLTIMARILAAEYELDADTADKFISGLAGKVGGGAAFMPATAVFGAIKALPFNKASKSIRRIMRGETPSNDYERMVRQAIEDGILQGQLYSVDNFDLARKRVVADMKRLETGDVGGVLGNAKKATRFVGETLDLTLTAIDMVNRMHVYTAAVEAGISRQTATVMARESLVDFAKKGTAARGIGQFLLFFSPRMQGIHQLTRSFAMLRSTGTRLAVRALAAKFLWSFVSSMVRELFYEDDEDASTMISKFAAERNLIIPAWMDSETGQWSWVQITEPYGFGAVSRAGTAVADMLVGDVSPVKTLATVAGAFASEAMPITVYDPTSLQSWFQAAVPTPVSPLLDLAFNTDYKGSPIAPLGAQFGAGDPRTSEQYFADTPSYYIKAAALMSAITAPIGRALGGGGSRGIEVSPNQIEYLLGRFLPGVVNDAVRMIEVGSDYAGGSAISINEVPVLSKVVGESGGRRVLPGQFRDIDAIFERIRTDLKYESPAEVLSGASPLERWLAGNQFWPSARRAIKGLQQQRNEMLRAGNRVAARRIEERMNMLRERAVNQALRIQNLESGPGFDTRVGRYFRGGDQ